MAYSGGQIMSEASNQIRGPHQGPHQGQPALTAGEPLDKAKADMIMVHGLEASAEDILSLTPELNQPGFAYLALQAAGYAWYPNSFLAPIASNEPGLSSGLAVITSLFAKLAEAGISPERTILLGFSQGACLSLEFAARNARRYGGLAGLSGGLIGPEGTPRDYPGSLDGTPVFLGCSDIDGHIPLTRVQESSRTLRGLGGDVVERIYPGFGHTINEDEVRHVRAVLDGLIHSTSI